MLVLEPAICKNKKKDAYNGEADGQYTDVDQYQHTLGRRGKIASLIQMEPKKKNSGKNV